MNFDVKFGSQLAVNGDRGTTEGPNQLEIRFSDEDLKHVQIVAHPIHEHTTIMVLKQQGCRPKSFSKNRHNDGTVMPNV